MPPIARAESDSSALRTVPAVRPVAPAMNRRAGEDASLFPPVAITACLFGIVVGLFIALLAFPVVTPHHSDMLVALGSLAIATGTAWRAARAEIEVERLKEREQAERSYEIFIDNAIEGFFRTTFDGRYIKVNAALVRIYGYESEEQLMAGITDIGNSLYVDPAQRDAFIEKMQNDGHVQDFVSEIHRRDGSTIWITENARAVYDAEGQVLFYEGTVEDITVQRKAEEALRSALQETQEPARAKAAFLAAMSHELKMPLNAVIGFSDLMIQKIFGPITEPRYAGYVEDIHRNGIKLLEMINDILDLTRVEGGQLEIDDDRVSLAQVIPEASRQAASQAVKPPALALRIAENLPPLLADKKRVRQILVHILSNAVKFTPASGSVSVEAARAADGGIVVVVADNGIGMSPDRITHALEPFKQLDTSLARRFEGAGLGLPLANALVKLHGGWLTIQSAQGRGTIVTVHFPAERVMPYAVSLCA
jgi:PAS domain S-box-containing protein